VAIIMVGFFTFVLLLLWAIFLSRMRWKFRLTVLGTLVGVMLLGKILFRVHGVTGDFVPILQWRWSRAVWGFSRWPRQTWHRSRGVN